MGLFASILNEFCNQSINFSEDSLSTRRKRIQTIFKNLPILVFSVVSFGIVRFAILFIEPSSFGTTIVFSIFIPVLVILLIKLSIYSRENSINCDSTKKMNLSIITQHENTIGFYSSFMTFWVILMIPISIYYEYPKFDKGTQFMMAKITMNLDFIILMQPKKTARFTEVIFTLSYFIMLIFKTFSFIDIFFAFSACTSTYFTHYIATQLNNEYTMHREKEKMMKLNSDTFKVINDPVIIVDSSVTKSVFKNQAFLDLQQNIHCENEIEILRNLKDSTNTSLSDVIRDSNNSNKPSNSKIVPKEAPSLFTLNANSTKENKITYIIKKSRKKYKHFTEEMIAIFFQDVGKEMELKILEGNREFTFLMLYSLSHEIRTPINGMKGILQLIKDKAEMKYYKQIKFALSCCEFLVNQVNCMLDYSQILKKEFRIHLDLVDIRAYFNKIKKNCMSILDGKQHSVKIKINVSDTIPKLVILDKDRIKQIILILVTNSIKYTENGDINLRASLNIQSELEIAVSDTGCGFTPEEIEIFNNEKADSLIKYNKGKRGFPGYKLSMCQLLINELKSKIILTSKKNLGSTFTFSFSNSKLRNSINLDIYKRSESGTILDEDFVPTNQYQRYIYPTILLSNSSSRLSETHLRLPKPLKYAIIVDDIEMNRFVILNMIKKLNFSNLLEASNGKEALEIAKEKASNGEEFIIFMDIDMPIMNGIESAKLIRQFSKQPIIAVTAFVGEEIRVQAKESGMNLFLTKPISFSRIKSILKDYNYI